ERHVGAAVVRARQDHPARQASQVLAAEYDRPCDTPSVDKVDRQAEDAQCSTPGVWPQRLVQAGSLRGARVASRAALLGRRSASDELSHLVNRKIQPQVIVAYPF